MVFLEYKQMGLSRSQIWQDLISITSYNIYPGNARNGIWETINETKYKAILAFSKTLPTIIESGLASSTNNEYFSKWKNWVEWWKTHCLKSVQIRNFSWSVFSRIQSECGKSRTRKNSVFGHFSRSDKVKSYPTDPYLCDYISKLRSLHKGWQ